MNNPRVQPEVCNETRFVERALCSSLRHDSYRIMLTGEHHHHQQQKQNRKRGEERGERSITVEGEGEEGRLSSLI